MTVHAPGVLADLVDQGGIGVAVLDGKRRYRYVNPCLAKLAGRPVTEHIGRTMREVLPEFAHLIEPAVDRVSRGDSDVAVTIRAGASAGTPAEWEATYVPITLEGGERGVGILIMDVTDRQMAAAETRRRLQQQAALATLGQLALGPASLDEVLQAATDMLARELGADFAGVLAFAPERDHLWMRAGTGFRDEAVGRMTAAVGVDSQAGYTLLCNDAVLTPDTTREDRFTVSQNVLDLGVRSAISVPIPGTDEAFGVLGVLSGQPACFDQDDANMLRATANVLGATVVRDAQAQVLQELAAQRGRLVAQALDAAESEQRRVADVLHDDVLQHLLFARLELRGIDIAPELANRLQRSIEEATTLLRRVIGGLHPITLSHAGLPGAIDSLAEEFRARAGLRIDVRVAADLPRHHDRLIVSIVRELLSNVVKHAGATRATVHIAGTPRSILVHVADDGRGLHPDAFDAALSAGNIGLAKTRERVAALGGASAVEAGLDGRGAGVTIHLPR